MLMNPRNKDGFALSDGECCERLWSFMRRFSRITKEMRPAHRMDVLTDALLHFGRLTVASLSKQFFKLNCMVSLSLMLLL